MSLKTLIAATGVVAFVLSGTGYAVAGTELRVHGSVAVGTGIIKANQAAIERDTGLTLNVIVNGDGNGLKDLYSGKTDLAMIGSPIKLLEAGLNAASPGSISVADFQVAPVGADIVRFIVNPANPVKSLTEAQVRDIFTGKITTWKEVGGADQPIVVVTGAPNLGARLNVVALFLGGTDITGTARTVQQLSQVAQVVAQVPNAIGYGNAGSITGAVAVITGAEVKQTLYLVSKGAPTAEMRQLIEATAKYGAKGN